MALLPCCQGNADLSFEKIQGQIAQVIKQDKTDTPVSSLSMVFEQYAKPAQTNSVNY